MQSMTNTPKTLDQNLEFLEAGAMYLRHRIAQLVAEVELVDRLAEIPLVQTLPESPTLQIVKGESR